MWQEYEDGAREALSGLWQNEGEAIVSDDDQEAY
jgi:hypothetical protein